MNYDEDLKIDVNALEIEWINQPTLAMQYGRNYAECKRIVADASERVKVVRAELIRAANTDPETCCGKSKPNAADIEAYYRNHKKHKDAKEEWVQAVYELDIAEIAKNEIGYTRKSALENLVRLFGQQYFAGPSAPRDINVEWEKHEKQKQSNKSVKMKRKRN